MEPRKVRTVADARAIVAERGLTHVKCGVFDIDGILRGKYMSRRIPSISKAPTFTCVSPRSATMAFASATVLTLRGSMAQAWPFSPFDIANSSSGDRIR